MRRLAFLFSLAVIFAGFWLFGVGCHPNHRVNNWNRPDAYFEMWHLAHHTQLMWAETGECPGADPDEPWDTDFTAEFDSWTESTLYQHTRLVIDGVVWYEDELGRFTYEVERDDAGEPVHAVWRHLGRNGRSDGGDFDDIIATATIDEYTRTQWDGRGPKLPTALVVGALACLAGAVGVRPPRRSEAADASRPKVNGSSLRCPVVAITLGEGTGRRLVSVEPTAYFEGVLLAAIALALSWAFAIGHLRGWGVEGGATATDEPNVQPEPAPSPSASETESKSAES